MNSVILIKPDTFSISNQRKKSILVYGLEDTPKAPQLNSILMGLFRLEISNFKGTALKEQDIFYHLIMGCKVNQR